MRGSIKFNFALTKCIFFSSIMFSIETNQQLLCPTSTSCECILGGQEVKCVGSHDEAKNIIKSLNYLNSIETLELQNFKTPIDKSIVLNIPLNKLIIKNSVISILSIVLNGIKRLNHLNLINTEINGDWDWGAMFDQLSQLKDFRLESSSLPSKVLNIKIGHRFKTDNILTVSFINCQIESIDSNVINKWSKLRMISLANNKISRLDRNWFSSQLYFLWSLDLSYNSISDIPKDFFTGMRALKKLRLDNNSFLTLKDSWFLPIWPNLSEFWINPNQIECSSDLSWVMLTAKYPYFFDEGVCHSSIENKARYFVDLRLGDGELSQPINMRG